MASSFTASEDEDHIAFNDDHVKHDMNDGPNENVKKEAESERIGSMYSETTPFVVVETTVETGEEIPDDRIAGEGHHARCAHPVVYMSATATTKFKRR